jgi:hypothetical protein
MQRGKPVSEGFVRFPFDSPEYPACGGGGMVVKLVVLDELPDEPGSLAMCTGASVFDFLQEILVGDDQRPVPVHNIPANCSPEDVLAHLEAEAAAHREWMRFHYAGYGDGDVMAQVSRHYRAAIVLGSTGWAGYSAEKGNWHAAFDDLTDKGQALYRMMEQLNPGCPLHILTFLDT